MLVWELVLVRVVRGCRCGCWCVAWCGCWEYTGKGDTFVVLGAGAGVGVVAGVDVDANGAGVTVGGVGRRNSW